MKLGILALRAVFGLTMLGHGLQKLLGWFGGSGLDATAAGFERTGLLPARRNAVLAAATESAGGASVLLGLHTPLGAAAMTGTMSVAVAHVHGKNGLWITKGGCEYNLAIIAAAFAIADLGPGPLAFDGARTALRAGPKWAVAQLIAGTVGAAIVVANAKRERRILEQADTAA